MDLLQSFRESINKNISIGVTVLFALGGVLFSFLFNNLDNAVISFVYSVSIAILSSYIFYVLVVYFPDKKRKKAIKTSFQHHFTDFKRIVIGIFISATQDTYNENDVEPLFDLKKFREFFKSEAEPDQTKWDVIATKLDNDGAFRHDLLVEMEILRGEILFVLNNVYIGDEHVYSFLKDFTTIIYRNQQINYDEVEVKTLCQLLWQIFTGWSWAKGYPEEDIFQLVLSRI